jgi:Leucine-rich repeat (LRR) protein
MVHSYLLAINDWMTWLIAPLLVGLLLQLKGKTLLVWLRPKTHLADPDLETEVSQSSRYFIANKIAVYSRNEEEIKLKYHNDNRQDLKQFIQVLLQEKTKFYLILAPTGVGKTTYLSNIFLEYRDYSRFSNAPLLYFGRIHSASTIQAIDKLISSNKSENTILLLDGLDEYKLRHNTDPAKYWEDFERQWNIELVEKRLSKFKRVIVSVREQFLLLPEMENISIDNYSYGRKIRLLPFESGQRERYIQKRFPGNNPEEVNHRDGMIWLCEKFIEKGISIIEKPLILYFIEILWTDYLKNKNTENYFFNNYNLFETIVTNWLSREEKGSESIHKTKFTKLWEHCESLAYASVLTQPNAFNSQQLTEIENSLDMIAKLKDTSGRTLLTRQQNETYEKGNLLSIAAEFRFIHNTFLEFFLVTACEKNPDIEKNLPLEKLDFAFATLIGRRWRNNKKNAPEITLPEKGRLVLSREELLEWKTFFQSLTINEKCQKLLQESPVLYKILEKEDPDWRAVFKDLATLEINNDNFWDFSANKPLEGIESAIQYLLPFIFAIDFSGIPITNKHLSCFNNARHLFIISFEKIDFTNIDLEAFSQSMSSIEVFGIGGCTITDSHLSVLSKSKKLSLLSLPFNNLSGEFLEYLPGNRDSLKELYIVENKITDLYLKNLTGFKKLEKLHLGANKLTGEGFKYLKDSVENLTLLDIRYNEISDQYFSVFENCKKINQLILTKNHITGKGLIHFKNSSQCLEKVSMDGNEITDEGLIFLTNAYNLRELGINHNKITDAGIAHIRNILSRLTLLHIFENPISEATKKTIINMGSVNNLA